METALICRPGLREAGGEQAYEYVAPKEPKDWVTVEEIRGMLVGADNYFESRKRTPSTMSFVK